MTLIGAIRMCIQDSITPQDVEDVRHSLAAFGQYYEERYYARRSDRLGACLPVIHQLAHVADYLKIIGPMWAYSQWCMERMCGLIVTCAKNRFWANRQVRSYLSCLIL